MTHLKGAIIQWVEHPTTKRKAPIRLDKRSMTFFAREDDSDPSVDPFSSKDGAAVEAWLYERLKYTTAENNMEWVPAIHVTWGGETEHQYRDQQQLHGESVEVTIDRVWLGLTRDRVEWRTLRWSQGDPDHADCVPENERYAQSSHHALGPKSPALHDTRLGRREKPFRLPSYGYGYRTRHAWLPYTDELWQGLLMVVAAIKHSRKSLADLLGTKAGIETVSAVGAGQQPLQLMAGK